MIDDQKIFNDGLKSLLNEQPDFTVCAQVFQAKDIFFTIQSQKTDLLANDPFSDDFARRLNLTFREVEIIRLIKEGLNNEQIAERLNLSFFTKVV